MPLRLPDPIAHIFAPNLIQPEDITLDPEDPALPEPGQAKMRALDGFLFVKDGRFVYPSHHLPDAWWKGVLAYGYTAALTGPYKYFVWGGLWDEEYDGRHLEVVILANLTGLSKARSPHWRNGFEPILWLDTAQGYTYALLGPAEEYDRGSWQPVIDSWTHPTDPRRRADPSFLPLKPGSSRPNWWGKNGIDAWNHWTGNPVAYVSDDEEEEHPPDGPPPAQSSCDPIYIDSGSSDEEDGPTSLSPPSLMLANKQKTGASQQHTDQERRLIDVAREVTEPSSTRGRKRRVVSGPTGHAEPRRQKTEEPIYVSDSSDDGKTSHRFSSPTPLSSISAPRAETPLVSATTAAISSCAIGQAETDSSSPDQVQEMHSAEHQSSVAVAGSSGQSEPVERLVQPLERCEASSVKE